MNIAMTRRNSTLFLTLVAALGLVFASGAYAQTKKKTRHARRAAPPAAAAPAAASGAASEESVGSGFGVSESLAGTIEMVVPEQRLLVVTGPNGVPYDLIVGPKTVIVVGDKAGTLESLTAHVGMPVSVGFVPQRDGNHATRIEVTG